MTRDHPEVPLSLDRQIIPMLVSCIFGNKEILQPFLPFESTTQLMPDTADVPLGATKCTPMQRAIVDKQVPTIRRQPDCGLMVLVFSQCFLNTSVVHGFEG